MSREGEGARDTRLAGHMPYSECARTAAVARAKKWTRSQAERLGTSPEVILDAIRERAWLPEQIEEVTRRYALEYPPPPLAGVPDWFDMEIKNRGGAQG